MDNKLKIGIIGCGDIGAYTSDCINKTTNAKVSMAMDTNISLAMDLGNRHKVQWTDDLNELLTDKGIDAVYIATPHYLHTSITIKAAHAKKHVIVEKPIATNLKDADMMITECKRNNVKLSVCFCLRFEPWAIKAKELIEKGSIGKVISIHFNVLCDKSLSYWEGGFSQRAKTDWRTLKEKSGGGILIMNASHNIDYIGYITGFKAKRVYSEYGTFSTPVEVEDILFGTIVYDNGTLGVIEASSCFRGGATAGLQEQALACDKICGTDGQIVLSNPLRVYTTKSVEGFAENSWNILNLEQFPDSRQKYFEEFAKAVLEGKEPQVSAEDGRNCLEIVTAIYLAGKEHRPIELS